MKITDKALQDSAPLRWGVLLLISFTIFSSYFFYDVFTGIKSTMTAALNFSNSDFGTMLGWYGVANTFFLMTIFGGIFLDKWGIRKTGAVFSFFMFLGALITAYGGSDFFRDAGPGYAFFSSFKPSFSPELKMMMLGRFFFGMGSETVIVISSKVMVKWFKGKELALAFGINLAIARIGTISALWLSPFIKNVLNWQMAAWLGAGVVAAGLMFYLIHNAFDLKYDQQPDNFKSNDDEEEEEFHVRDILKLIKNPSYIYICLLCVLFYSAVFPFLNYTPDLLYNKFGMSEEWASKITSIIPFGTVIFTPLFGYYVDKKGKAASLMIWGSLILILVHITLSMTDFPPYLPLIALGVAFSLVPAAMWPSVGKIVPLNRLGTAYGLMTTIQNFGLMLFPWLIGVVLDKTNKGISAQMVKNGSAHLDYTYAILMLVVLGFFAILFAYLLKHSDKKYKLGLEKPSND